MNGSNDMVTKSKSQNSVSEQAVQQSKVVRNPFSLMLLESKNLILRGAPGTGKSYLAKSIAADIVSNGQCDKFEDLTDDQKRQIEFVQFHPSYDYSDFVEGLRPRTNDDGTIGFELRDGIFKKFIARARKNYENRGTTTKREFSAEEAMNDFFSNIELEVSRFKTFKGIEFVITGIDDEKVTLFILKDIKSNVVKLKLSDIKRMLEYRSEFKLVKDVVAFLFGNPNGGDHSNGYYYGIYMAIRENIRKLSERAVTSEEPKRYVFVIDEINRGEISKIFGELFFSIDPEYRGRAGEISTQYSNLHSDPDEKFYIPENVYVIGTMNDIDRSVDTFDFAMRRRFRFCELRADEHLEMLDSLNDDVLKSEAIKRMTALNKEIAAAEDLNENYQIGASYFLKLKNHNFDQLWTDYLQPLLQEYIHGTHNEKELMKTFAHAYGYQKDDENGVAQAQG